MYSSLYPETSQEEGASNFICQPPVKRVSVQAQLPSKFYNEKFATSRLRSAVFVDEARASRYRRLSRRPSPDYCTTETEVLVSALSAGTYQKPWPSRKGTGVEELVKYMSSVPCYLQQSEEVESIQEKALNFGVIDWKLLEKWTNSQKTDQKTEVSPSINKSINKPMSPFSSKNQSCSYSTQSSSDYLPQWKKTSSFDSHQVRSTDEKSRFMSDTPNSRTSPISRSLWSYHENHHENRSSMQAEAGNTTEDVESIHCDNQSSTQDGLLSDSCLERDFLEHGRVVDPLQDGCSVSNKTLSSMHDDRKTMELHKNLSTKVLQRSSEKGSVSRNIPHSDLTSPMNQSEESDIGVVGLKTTIGVTSKFMTNKEVANRIGNSTSKFVASTDELSGNQNVRDISVGKKQQLIKQQPSFTGLKWLSRTSSLKDMSTTHQLKDINGLDISGDKGRSKSRGRRSPLRRILDPLLKPRSNDNSRPSARSPIHCSQEQFNNISLSTGKESFSKNTINKSSDAIIDPSNCQYFTSNGLLQDESYGVAMRQALVKLVWKNAQPLFMFSTNDNDVLVASMRITGRLGKDDPCAVYTIVSAQETKRKGGIWTSQNRNRKPSLVYDVVGHMEVSCPKLSIFYSKHLEISTQFVLVGDKLLPHQESMNSAHSSELVAIVVKAPYHKLKDSIYNTHVESLQIEKYPEYSRMCSLAAILPSGIHGFSDTGKPSTIIERWKSGGSCDCGGWDEGCRLTVLTNRDPEIKIPGPIPECPVTHGIKHIKLFFESKEGENKYAFSMTAFKECLYTVEFGPSITSLQTFAICIAALHNVSVDAVDNYPRTNSIQRNRSLTGYEPHHPPFSPVGRS